MKKVIAAVYILGLLCIFGVSGCSGDIFEEPERENTTVVDTGDYFGDPGSDEYAVVCDRDLKDYKAVDIGGEPYVRLDAVKYEFNDRFFWEEEDEQLIYTDLNGTVSIPYEMKDGKVYVLLDVVKEYSDIDYKLIEDLPKRVVLWRDVLSPGYSAEVTKTTELRTGPSVKEPILTVLSEGEASVYTGWEEEASSDEETGFVRVMTDDGFIGYAKEDCLDIDPVRVPKRDINTEENTPNLMDEPVCLVWHQITNNTGNSGITDHLPLLKGVNVVSPTWFYIKNSDGGISDIGSRDYVAACHEYGMQVWGLVANFGGEYVDTGDVLAKRSARSHLVNELIDAAERYSLDGINVDFELLESDEADSFLQFIRELSLSCREKGLCLSVDNYVPTASNYYYNRKEQAHFADYIIVMAYDEHWAGSDDAGSVASLGFLEDGVTNTLNAKVPKEQLIQANPFYTRIWEESPKTDIDEDSVEAASEDFNYYEVSSEAVGMGEQKRRIEENDAEVTYLSDMGQNYAQYEKDGCKYKVWMEDEVSLKNRMEIFKKYDIGGVAFWKLGLEDKSLWEIISGYMG